jgi:hypothetical protein
MDSTLTTLQCGPVANTVQLMPWYYAKDGRQHGPVTDVEFDRWITEGAITPDTLVWREGMAAWQRCAEVRSLTPALAPPVLAPPVLAPVPAGDSTCCECGRAFRPDELVQVLGRPVCAACKPLHLQRLQEHGPAAAEAANNGVWRQGKLLIVRARAELPPRCVRCNEPATWTGPVKLAWNPPWIYLTFLLSLLVLIIVALLTRKTATVVIPLCETHRRRRAKWRVAAGIIIRAGLLMMGLGWLVSTEAGAIGLGLGILLALIGAIISSRASWILIPRRIDREYTRLKGCCPEFLDRIPPFPGT